MKLQTLVKIRDCEKDMRPLRTIRCSSILSALAVAAGCLISPFPGTTRAAETIAAEPKEMAATVNGVPIYEEQLRPEVEQELGVISKIWHAQGKSEAGAAVARQGAGQTDR